MAMKLPTSPTHGPSRGVPRTSGSFSGLSLRNLVSPLGDKAGPAISGTTLERSRTRPWASSMPGFSRPGAPKRTSFIQRLLARYRGFLDPPLPWAGGAGEGFVFVAVNEENQSRRESPFLFPDKRRGQEGAAPGPSNTASSAPRLQSARKGAAVNQEILTGDIAGLRRAKKRAGRAEFIGIADPPGRNRGHPLGERSFGADAPLLHGGLDIGLKAISREHAGQEEIDRHVGAGDAAGDAGEERGQAGTCAGGKIEAGDRRPYRTRSDVDDPAELL